jgi:hypothetical protein
MTRAERARPGMEDLLPGDFMIAPDTALVELRCPDEGGDAYRLRGPFRLVIDVPKNARCHINLLNGESNVLAESPTEQTVGGVTLGSRGTQYAIVMRRDSAGPAAPRVIVFDGQVDVSLPEGAVSVNRGRTLTYNPGRRPTLVATTPAQLQRWAGLYASFDVNEAMRNATTAVDRQRTYDELQQLHYEVLADPADTVKRVTLARAQLRYGMLDHATFNLRRAGVTTQAKLQQYQIRIDSSVVTRRVRGGGAGPRN